MRCYIVRPKDKVCLTNKNDRQDFLVKMIDTQNFKDFFQRTGQSFDQIQDKWIMLTPHSPHIIKCYEVFEDEGKHY